MGMGGNGNVESHSRTSLVDTAHAHRCTAYLWKFCQSHTHTLMWSVPDCSIGIVGNCLGSARSMDLRKTNYFEHRPIFYVLLTLSCRFFCAKISNSNGDITVLYLATYSMHVPPVRRVRDVVCACLIQTLFHRGYVYITTVRGGRRL